MGNQGEMTIINEQLFFIRQTQSSLVFLFQFVIKNEMGQAGSQGFVYR